MKKYLTGSLKVLGRYILALVAFFIFFASVLVVFKDNLEIGITIYSFVFFIFVSGMIFFEIKSLAIKENRPQYNINPHPLRGFIYGFIGFSPFIILEVVYFLITVPEDLLKLKQLFINALFGPLYWILKIGENSPISYIIATLSIPAITIISYIIGYYNLSFKKVFSKSENNN